MEAAVSEITLNSIWHIYIFIILIIMDTLILRAVRECTEGQSEHCRVYYFFY